MADWRPREGLEDREACCEAVVGVCRGRVANLRQSPNQPADQPPAAARTCRPLR